MNENIALLELSSQFEPTIAAIEQSHSLSARNTWSFYTKKPVSQTEWESLVSSAVEPIADDNPYLDIKPYQEVSAIDSINFKPGSYGLDILSRIRVDFARSGHLLCPNFLSHSSLSVSYSTQHRWGGVGTQTKLVCLCLSPSTCAAPTLCVGISCVVTNSYSMLYSLSIAVYLSTFCWSNFCCSLWW